MRVVKAFLVLSAVTSLARGGNKRKGDDTEDSEDHVDIDEANVGDEHHETPEEADGHYPEEAGEEDRGWELTKEQLAKVHTAIDANEDGKINIDEMIAYGKKMKRVAAKKYAKDDMADLDRNKDGMLSLDELFKDMGFRDDDEPIAKTFQERETKKFHAADENNDGLLDEHELVHLFNPALHDKVLEADAEGTMKHLDRNGDGKLDAAEFYHGVPEEGSEEEAFEMTDEDKAEFAKFDKDKDGFLNNEELRHQKAHAHHIEDALLKLIEMGDMDGDGHLTASELDKSKPFLEGSDAEVHLFEWAEHGEL